MGNKCDDDSIREKLSHFKKYNTCDKIGWFKISFRLLLSEKFMSEYKNFLYWNVLQKYQYMSKNFVKDHESYINHEIEIRKMTD